MIGQGWITALRHGSYSIEYPYHSELLVDCLAPILCVSFSYVAEHISALSKRRNDNFRGSGIGINNAVKPLQEGCEHILSGKLPEQFVLDACRAAVGDDVIHIPPFSVQTDPRLLIFFWAGQLFSPPIYD